MVKKLIMQEFRRERLLPFPFFCFFVIIKIDRLEIWWGSNMKIGEFLTLEAYSYDDKTVEKYRSKIIEQNDRYLYVDYPIHMKTKRTQASFGIGTKMIAEYLGQDQSVYRFKTEVMERRRGKIPTLALKQPKEDQIERIQRRQFVRVDTAVDVAIYSIKNSFSPFSTVTVDISGGGISVVIPKGVRIIEGENISIYLVLYMHAGEYHYLELPGQIVRLIERESVASTASIKFLELSEQDKQIIIRYCFEKQREARQKELQ
jgi:c-di-GMP-binding flagellar brake protein YcgR